MADIFKQKNCITINERAGLLGQTGAVLWFTGLSGSGKSTIACLSEKMLLEDGRYCFLLDGDNLRFGLNSDLGFSESDRSENIRRIAHVASLFAQSGAVAIVSAISPFYKDRLFARKVCEDAGCPFIECFVDTPIEVCIERDVKGLYKKAISGEIKSFTGISSPYEAPDNPDIVIKTADCTPLNAAEKAVEYLKTLSSLRSILPEIAAEAVKAGEKIMEIYSGAFGVEYKSDSSPLTAADLASNEIICSFLKRRFPQYACLSEESKDSPKRLSYSGCFIVDPLDGTKEFVKRNGEFTVNIALSYLGKSIMGIIYVPVSGELYYAAKGLGAYKKSHDIFFDEADRIHVSSRKSDLIVLASRSHSDETLTELLNRNCDKIGGTVSVGSSLKGCKIAEGSADAYYRTGFTMEWDTAAMQCIVEEAGGIFRQGDGTPMHYNRINSLNDKGFYIINSADNLFY